MGEAARDIADETDEAEASVETEGYDASDDWVVPDDDDFAIEGASWGERLPVIALLLLGLGWIGFVGWAAFDAMQAAPATPTQIANWIAIGTIPLALLGIVWLLLLRTSRREAMRFGRTSEAMRAEAVRLDRAMHDVERRLADLRQEVSNETDRLIALGEEAADRLGSISADMRSAGGVIEERSNMLDSSAKSAKRDMDVLLSDLPRAERQAKDLGEKLRNAGTTAHEQAGALDAQIAALATRGREADEIAGGAAQRLAATLSRIEGVSEVAARQLDETGEHIDAAVEAALEKSSAAVEETRRAIAEIGKTLSGLADNARITVEQGGADAAAALEAKIAATEQALTAMEAQFGEQGRQVETLLDRVNARLGEAETQFASLGSDGEVHVEKLRQAVERLEADMAGLSGTMGQNDERAVHLISRAAEVQAALDLNSEALTGALPEQFEALETRSAQTREAIAALGPDLETLVESAETVSSYVATSGESLSDQRERVERFVEQFGERIDTIRAAIENFEASLVETDERAQSIADAAAPRLVEILMKVRETADQAAEKSRAAFGDIIPQSAAALGEATREALENAMQTDIEARIGDINAAAERAIASTEEASSRLREQLAEVERLTEAMEARAERAQATAADADMDGFARQVTLLIESLNSTAIDVTKILSNDVTDTAWAAYLKGDRGIFARRAVKLLDTGEAREIASQYEFDAEFHGQVNRYIHDFEAMLRRVMATRDGSPLAVTLLSSDNGKLYVALAQAIERFRD